MIIKNYLNRKAINALAYPNIFTRIEECIINARTELAKRRLVRATVILSFIDALSIELRR